MGNRTTEKANIQALNIPSVTNAEMNTMLQNYLADNLQFREDVAVVQNSSLSSITVDFTGKDRVDLTRTGGALNITVSGLDDGDRKFLLITKTAGQVISWVGVTDVTPLVDNIDALSLVLYEIVSKGSNYYARAYALTVEAASQSEAEAGTSDDVVMTPLAQTYRDGGLLTKVVEIGDWDMDATTTKILDISSLGISSSDDIKEVSAIC